MAQILSTLRQLSFGFAYYLCTNLHGFNLTLSCCFVYAAFSAVMHRKWIFTCLSIDEFSVISNTPKTVKLQNTLFHIVFLFDTVVCRGVSKALTVLQELETESVFRICLSAETTPVSVQTYRERQRHLQRLEFTAVQNSLPSGPFSQV